MITRVQDHFIFVFIKKRHFWKKLLTMTQSLLCSKADEWDILWLLRGLSSQAVEVGLQINTRQQIIRPNVSPPPLQGYQMYNLYRYLELAMEMTCLTQNERSAIVSSIKNIDSVHDVKWCIAGPHLSSGEAWDADGLEEGWGWRTRHSCQCLEN